MAFQVLKFVQLDFDEPWTRTVLATGYASVLYSAQRSGAKLAVVTESATGVFETILFVLKVRDEVYVIDQVVHIPAKCVRRERGNTILCQG
ncbi:MAG: hypothetical protein EOO23_05130 [Comamonadaceae bacterium]|nr:MAG: hypothetical protein EOO23_05130 [Comamonadaceae bacterium]